MNWLTIVIPTYNRAEVLKKALDGYKSQSASQAIAELIVVDDGSTDHTKTVVEDSGKNCAFPVRHIWQSNKGPAAARNVGIREARSELMLFSDSDIVPAHDLVSQHLKSHSENPANSSAVLGYVTWPPEPKPTPFMKWYGEEGAMFAYGRFHRKAQLSFLDFYTCNVSLKTAFLRNCGQFDEDFKSAAYEDIELAYRLSKSGLRLHFNREAIGYHHQFFAFNDACMKAQANSLAARVFLSKEAGQAVFAPRLRRRSFLWFRAATLAARGIATALKPAMGLVDSSMPLPSIVYRLLFWNNTSGLLQSADGRRS